jgi:hypothetical protein
VGAVAKFRDLNGHTQDEEEVVIVVNKPCLRSLKCKVYYCASQKKFQLARRRKKWQVKKNVPLGKTNSGKSLLSQGCLQDDLVRHRNNFKYNFPCFEDFPSKQPNITDGATYKQNVFWILSFNGHC